MATTFPTSLQDLDATRGTSGQPLSNPNHITHHTNEDDTIEALQAKVGADGSAVTTSHDYKLSGVTGTDKAVSKTGTETLTSKTLTSPVLTTPVVNLGSDAEGDIYYRNSGGAFTRLPKGTDDYILKMNGNVPNWEQETVTNDASTTVKGIVEEATLAEIDANTAAGGTGARLFVNPSTLGKSTDGTLASNSDAKIPSEKAIKTYVDGLAPKFGCGQTNRAVASGTGTQNVAHGLGRAPSLIKITAFLVDNDGATSESGISVGSSKGATGETATSYYNSGTSSGGTQNASAIIYIRDEIDGGGTDKVVADISAVDSTNFTLNFTTLSGLDANTDQVLIQWEAFA